MRRNILSILFCFALIQHACKKPDTALTRNQDATDVCALLKADEIEAIRGSPVKETRRSENSEEALRVAQCHYSAAQSDKSVSLILTEPNLKFPGSRSAKELWRRTFEEHDVESEREERESAPPRKIDGIGQDAYWFGGPGAGALYVLKNDSFIRLSLAGPEDDETKINKSKALAEKILPRL